MRSLPPATPPGGSSTTRRTRQPSAPRSWTAATRSTPTSPRLSPPPCTTSVPGSVSAPSAAAAARGRSTSRRSPAAPPAERPASGRGDQRDTDEDDARARLLQRRQPLAQEDAREQHGQRGVQ